MYKTYSLLRNLCVFVLALTIAMGVGTAKVYGETYQHTLKAGTYKIVDAGEGYQEIKMEGFGQLLDPGKPKLPSKIFSISIPPGVSVNSVDAVGVGLTELEGTYRIVPAPMASALSATKEEIIVDKLEYEAVVQAAFESDTPYPSQAGVLTQQGAYRKYNLVLVRYSPFYYQANSGKLFLYPTLNVTINYAYAPARSAESVKLMEEYIPEAEERAAEFIINYEDAQQWYPALVDAPVDTTGGFVIITTDDLEDSIWPIKNWEICKGRDVHVETVEDIDTAFTGVDRAERIRNFLRAYLGAWGILKVMLIGDITDVPMRYTYPAGSDGNGNGTHWEEGDRVPTDYYYAELSLPDSTSWNSNTFGNDFWMYGHQGFDNVQFPNEVDVGRIPWSVPAIVENICMKMAEFEYSTDMDYKLNYLFTGAYFWDDTDNAVLKTYIINNALDPGYPPTRIYEQDPSCWNSPYYSEYGMSRYITREVWGNDYGDGPFGYVNLAGHGGSSGIVAFKERHPTCSPEAYFYGAADCPYLDDSHPAIVFSNACSTGWPENPNNLGKKLLEQGGVAVVASNRLAFGAHGWDDPSDGNCSTLDWLFSDKAAKTNGSRSSVGWSHQRALRDMYDLYNWDNSWWQFFEWNIYSNPDLWLNDRPSALPNLDEVTPAGWDDPIVPRSATGATDTWCPVTATLPGNTTDTYYNWAWTNNGSYDAPQHRTTVYLDDQWIFFSEPALNAGSIFRHMNLDTTVTANGGRHTLYYEIDNNDEVWETSESDNCWGRQYVWSPYALTDDVPINRSAPPDGDAWGCAPAPHYFNNDGFSFYVNFSGTNKWWSAVGILPYNSSADYDLRLWDIGDYTGSEQGFGAGYLEWSGSGPGVSDLVIVNRNVDSAGTYYAGTINANNQTGNFHIEEATSTKVYDGTNGPYAMSSTAVLDIYEYYMYAGDYGIKLEQTAGTCDLGMSLYDDETAHCQKSEYMADGYANSGGDGADEYMQVTVPDSGFHGLVVWKADSSDYSQTATYNIKVGQCATPGALSNPSPVDGATNVSVNTDLNWADSADTEYYEVWLREDYGTWVKLGETETSAWTLPTLNEDTHYDWYIVAHNICGDWVNVNWDFTTEAAAPPCEGDFNGDHDVDGSDLAIFAADFGRTNCSSGPPCEGDFNGDNDVDGSDLAIFAADFGRTDCP